MNIITSQFYFHEFAVFEQFLGFLGEGVANNGKIGLGEIVTSDVDFPERIGALEIETYFAN